ncbi:QSOX1 [Symbiodinium sp. CCMP2592]|nr:QSOX1 [Symbiodinium sp. CCMP2592]
MAGFQLGKCLAVLCLFARYGTAAGGKKLFQVSKILRLLDAARVEADIANARNPWVVMYYADWCPHCHHYAPVFERIAGAVSPAQQGAVVASGKVWLVHFGAAALQKQCDTGSPLGGKSPDKKMVHQQDAFVAWIRKNTPTAASSQPGAEANLTLLGLHTVPGALRGPAASSGATSVAPAAAASVLRQTEVQSPGQEFWRVLRDALPALHLVDAEVAILYSLSQGAFLKGSADGMLRGQSLEELQRWLDFLSRRLPGSSHRDLKALADKTREAVGLSETGDALAVSAFQELLLKQGLDRAPPEAGSKPDAYWRRCKGFTCGLWTLFHVLSQARGPPETAGQELLTRIRGFVANFFGCQQCREHFLEAFDSCKFDRCRLKADDTAGAALWLWKALAQSRSVLRRRPHRQHACMCVLASTGHDKHWPRLCFCQHDYVWNDNAASPGNVVLQAQACSQFPASAVHSFLSALAIKTQNHSDRRVITHLSLLSTCVCVQDWIMKM